MAPEGHRPRPRRLVPLAPVDRRRHHLRPHAAQLRRQGQPQGPPAGVPRGAARPGGARHRGDHGRHRLGRALHEARGRVPAPGPRRPRRPTAAASCSEDLDSVEARAFRNIAGVYVLAGAELETVDIVAARGDPGGALRVGAPDRRARRRPGRDPRADQEARAEEDGAAEAEAGPQGLPQEGRRGRRGARGRGGGDAGAAGRRGGGRGRARRLPPRSSRTPPPRRPRSRRPRTRPRRPRAEEPVAEEPAAEEAPKPKRASRKKAAPAEEPAAEAEEDAS